REAPTGSSGGSAEDSGESALGIREIGQRHVCACVAKLVLRVGAGRYRDGAYRQVPATRDVGRCVADDDDIRTGEAMSCLKLGPLDRDRGESLSLGAIVPEGTESEEPVETYRSQLQPGSNFDV